MKPFTIYKTTNLVNGKLYIGQDSKNKAGYLGSGKVLNYAIKKYGRENFKKEIMAWCYTKEHLDMLERLYIKLFNTKTPTGYNLTDGGGGTLGLSLSEDTRRKMGESRKGKLRPATVKEKIRIKLLGHKMSKETKEKIKAIKAKNRWHHTDEWKELQSKLKSGDKNAFYGCHHSDETKRKISTARKGKPWTEARRNAQLNKNKNGVIL